LKKSSVLLYFLVLATIFLFVIIMNEPAGFYGFAIHDITEGKLKLSPDIENRRTAFLVPDSVEIPSGCEDYYDCEIISRCTFDSSSSFSIEEFDQETGQVKELCSSNGLAGDSCPPFFMRERSCVSVLAKPISLLKVDLSPELAPELVEAKLLDFEQFSIFYEKEKVADLISADRFFSVFFGT